MSVVPRLMTCPSSTTCLVRRHGSFWCLLLQILMISWMSWGVEVDVDCLGGSYIFHHVWNIFLCRSWKLMYDDVCRYSVPYLCCKFVYSFLQCALHEDLNMPIICHYRGCFQYTVHSDLVQPLSAAALSSNLEKQVMTHASHRFIARQCIFMYSSLAWRWNAGMFERMDMDGAVPPFEQAFFPSNIVKGFLRNWTIQIFVQQISMILWTCWMNDSNSNIFPIYSGHDCTQPTQIFRTVPS